MTALQFLKNRGGYYSLSEIAHATGRSELEVQSHLDRFTAKGLLERRVYRARRIDSRTSGRGAGNLYESSEWQTLEQWRIAA